MALVDGAAILDDAPILYVSFAPEPACVPPVGSVLKSCLREATGHPELSDATGQLCIDGAAYQVASAVCLFRV
jgi:hypothetical protein